MAKKNVNVTITVSGRVSEQTLAKIFALMNGEGMPSEDDADVAGISAEPSSTETEPEKKSAEPEPEDAVPETRPVPAVVIRMEPETEPKKPAALKRKPPATPKKPPKLTVASAEALIQEIMERDHKNPDCVSAILACREVITRITEHSDDYSPEEAADLRRMILEELSPQLAVLKQFQKDMDPQKLAQSYYDRVLNWIRNGKPKKAPFFIVLEKKEAPKADEPRLPPKFTKDRINGILPECEDTEAIERRFRRVIGFVKGDARFTDAERQELLLHIETVIMQHLLRLGAPTKDTLRTVEQLRGAPPITPEPRASAPPGSEPSPVQLSEPVEASTGENASDAAESVSEPPGSEPAAENEAEPVSEEDEKARRRAEAEALAAAAKEERLLKRALAEAKRNDPNYGASKRVPTPEPSLKNGKKDKEGKKSGRRNRAA